MASLPFLLNIYRLRLWLLSGAFFTLMKSGSEYIRKVYQKKTIAYIKKHIKDPDTVKSLIPVYPLGAKRVLFSDTYYAALARENVSLVTEAIQKINTSGIISTDNKEYPVDILIYATGFITNPFLLGLDIFGKHGKALSDHWKEGPKNYLGMAIDGFPNLFMMYGPNTNLGHNSIILMIEAQASYIARCIHHVLENKLNAIDVQETQMIAYTQSVQKRLRDMIWANIDDSWYKSEKGDLPNNYPGRTMEYMRETRGIDWSAYNLV